MPRFVILEHDHPQLHWDLMLECGDVLWTWRLPQLPRPGDTLDAERVFDHRLVYLDYEGPISGNRGQVLRREQGAFAWRTREESLLEIQLDGDTLRGVLRLTRKEGEKWELALVWTL
jgi:DNA polymerase Ligase (LigD)